MNRYPFFASVVLGVGVRAAMLITPDLINGGDVDVYLADEGVVGLMAKHIVEGNSWPVFFYGQHYLGALEAYSAALVFAVMGSSYLSLHVTTLLYSLGLAAAVHHFTYRAYSVAAARWAAALVAVAPMYFLQWNFKARGGFIEHVFLLFVLLLLFLKFYVHHRRGVGLSVLLGLTAGVAVWVNQLAVMYVITLAAVAVFGSIDRRGYVAVAVGFCLGASLLVGYNVVHPLATARSLARKSVVLNRVPIQERDERWLLRGLQKRAVALRDGADKVGLVFGVPVSSSVERLGMSEKARQGGPLAPWRRALFFVPLLVFGCAVMAARPRRGKTGWAPPATDQILWMLFGVTLLVGYVSPRYMLPVYPLGAVLVGRLVARLHGPASGLLQVGIVGVLLLNIAGWADARIFLDAPESRIRSELVGFLRDRGLQTCYSAGSLYHIVFAADEDVILAPLQKDRYPAYGRAVDASASICYVFRDDQSDKRQHRALMEVLSSESVAYRSERVGNYNVFYEFEPRQALSREVIESVRRQETVRVQIPSRLGG